MKIAQECFQKFPSHGTCFFLWREAGLGKSRSLLKCQHLQTLETEVNAFHSVYLTIVGGRDWLTLHSTCWGPDSSPSTRLALGSVHASYRSNDHCDNNYCFFTTTYRCSGTSDRRKHRLSRLRTFSRSGSSQTTTAGSEVFRMTKSSLG